jgi:ferredoxin
METIIYVYSGTGNSLWVAKKLSAALGNTEIVPVSLAKEARITPVSQNAGIIFPVHIWGIPAPVVDFINRLEADSSKHCFAVAVHAGQVAATLIQLRDLMQKKNVKLSSGFSICMPSNYIPWSGAVSPQKQQKLFHEALIKINKIASHIKNNKETPPEKGPAWQNYFFSKIYNLSYSKVAKMDKSFLADEKCTGCGICEKICPARNILLKNGSPRWQNNCEQCFACLQWCPDEAIQYGKVTAKKKRYHHPEISLKEMLSCVRQ